MMINASICDEHVNLIWKLGVLTIDMLALLTTNPLTFDQHLIA